MAEIDLDTLTDEELEVLATGKAPKQKKATGIDLDSLTDEELEILATGKTPLQNLEAEDSSLLQDISEGALGALQFAGETVDRFTGAPTRAAIGAFQDARGFGESVASPLSAFVSQFGEDPKLAPTGREIAEKAGVEEITIGKPTISEFTGREIGPLKVGPGEVGFAIDVLADPTNIIPGVAVAKGVGKGAKAGVKGVGKVIEKTAKAGAKVADKAAELTAPTRLIKEKVKQTANILDEALNPKIADDFNRLSEIATKNGIDPNTLPEAVKFGESSVISRMSRGIAEGPLGQQRLENFNEAFLRVNKATDNKIEQIAGLKPLSNQEAGDLIRKGYDDAVEGLFNDLDFTYTTVVDQLPGVPLADEAITVLESKLKGIERAAKGLKDRGITNVQRGQADQLLRAVEAIRNTNGSLKQSTEALRMIGDAAYKSRNVLADIPPDVKKLRELYNTLRDGIIETSRIHLGDDVADGLIGNNAILTNFMEQKKAIESVVGNSDIASENVFKRLIQNGNSKTISSLKEILAPEQFNILKGSFMENLVRRNPDGSFPFKSLHNALRSKKDVAAVLFEPDELAEIGELITLGDRFGNSVLSSSGTGASNAFRNLTRSVTDRLTDDNILDVLKKRAVKGQTPEEVMTAVRDSQLSPKMKDAMIKALKKQLKPTKKIDRRGPLERALKSTQVLSVQRQNDNQKRALERRLRGK